MKQKSLICNLLFLLSLLGCRDDGRLQGSWKDKDGGNTYIFDGNGSYHFKSIGGDLIVEIEGKYKMCTDLGQDGHPLLVLAPSPFISPSGDTIKQHSVYEILKLTNEELLLEASSQPRIGDSLPNRMINKKTLFLREQ